MTTLTTGEVLTLAWIWTFTAVGGFFFLRAAWRKRRGRRKR